MVFLNKIWSAGSGLVIFACHVTAKDEGPQRGNQDPLGQSIIPRQDFSWHIVMVSSL